MAKEPEKKAPPKPSFDEISASGASLDFTGYLGEILPPGDPLLQSLGGDLKHYESLLRDEQVTSAFQQRRRAATSTEWEVVAASEDRVDEEAAEFIREQFEAIKWDRVTEKMLFGVFYGYAVSECLWARDGNRIVLDAIKVRKAKRFRWGRDGTLRLVTAGRPQGIVMPERKFWTYSAGADNDDEPYGLGLAYWLYWPVFLKRNGVKFWAISLEKFGAPTTVGKYSPSADNTEKKKLLEAAAAVATDQAVVVPEGMTLELPPEWWPRVRPKPGTLVQVRVVPAGGGGGSKKNPLRTILTITVIAASFYLPGAILGPGKTGVDAIVFGSLTKGQLLGAGISIVGTLLVDAIAPPPVPKYEPLGGVPSPERDSPNFSIAGARNALAPWGVVPCLLGRERMFPPHGATPYTEIDGEGEQYLNLLFDCGYGPIAKEADKIGETLLGQFEGVETEFRRGFQPSQLTQKGAWDPYSGAFPATPVFGDVWTVTPYVEGSQPGAVDTGTDRINATGHSFADGDRVRITADDSPPAPLKRETDYWITGAQPNDFQLAASQGGQPLDLTDAGAGSFSFVRQAAAGFEVYDGATTIVYQDLGTDSTDPASWDIDGDQPHTLITNSVGESTELPVEFTKAGGRVVRASGLVADKLGVEVAFFGGLVSFTNAGTKTNRTVEFLVEYRPMGAGDGGWTEAGTLSVTARRTNVVRQGLRWSVPRGQYEVGVTRLTDDTTSSQIRDDASWSALRTITAEDPIDFPGLATLAMRIKATGQLNGIVDRYNFIGTSIALDWDSGAGAWVMRPTRRPASLYRLCYQGAANAEALTDNEMDISGLEAWHDANVAGGFTFDAIVDYRTTVDRIAFDIAAAGRASIADSLDGKRGVVVEEPQSVPVQYITPENSWGYTGRRVFRDLPHAFRTRFRNPDKGYRLDERIVYRDGYHKANATRFEGLDAVGRTDAGLAWDDGRFHIAQAELRQEEHTWWMDIEHMVYRRGKLVHLTHDAPVIGLGTGRVAARQESGGDVLGVTVNDLWTMEAGKSYAVRFRLKTGAHLYSTIVTAAGETNTVTFTTPIPIAGAPEVGDLVGFGEAGLVSIELIVTGIRRRKGRNAQFTGVPAAPEIHDAGILGKSFVPGDVDAGADTITIAGNPFHDAQEVQFTTTGTLPGGLAPGTMYFPVNRTTTTLQVSATEGGAPIDLTDGGSGTHTITRQIPAHVSNIADSAALSVPVVTQLRSDGTALLRAPDGSLSSRILAAIARPSGLQAAITGIQPRFRESGSAGQWTLPPPQDPQGGEVSIEGVEDGETYDTQFRYVTNEGDTSEWSAAVAHTVLGKTDPPPQPAWFTAAQSGDTVVFRWPQNPDLDRDGVDITFGLRGGDAALAEELTDGEAGTTSTKAAVAPGDWTFYLLLPGHLEKAVPDTGDGGPGRGQHLRRDQRDRTGAGVAGDAHRVRQALDREADPRVGGGRPAHQTRAVRDLRPLPGGAVHLRSTRGRPGVRRLRDTGVGDGRRGRGAGARNRLSDRSRVLRRLRAVARRRHPAEPVRQVADRPGYRRLQGGGQRVQALHRRQGDDEDAEGPVDRRRRGGDGLRASVPDDAVRQGVGRRRIEVRPGAEERSDDDAGDGARLRPGVGEQRRPTP